MNLSKVWHASIDSNPGYLLHIGLATVLLQVCCAIDLQHDTYSTSYITLVTAVIQHRGTGTHHSYNSKYTGQRQTQQINTYCMHNTRDIIFTAQLYSTYPSQWQHPDSTVVLSTVKSHTWQHICSIAVLAYITRMTVHVTAAHIQHSCYDRHHIYNCIHYLSRRAQWLSGRASNPRLRGTRFESCAAVLKPSASFFTLHCSSSLSCINEYLAIDSGDYVYEQPSRINCSMWLDASQRSLRWYLIE